MPIDLSREQTVTIAVARKQLIPRIGDKPISPATAYRWINPGVLAEDGTRVRLSAVKLGRTLVTTREAVGRFLDELTRRSQAEPASDQEMPAETKARLRAEKLLPEEQLTGAASGRPRRQPKKT
jgi:hypothetical protein